MHRRAETERRYLVPMWFFLLALLLAACGGSTNAGSTSSGSNNSAVGSNTPSIPILGTANGCPSSAVVTSTASGPNVITVNSTQVNQTIPLRNGNIIEVRLPFGHKWTGPTTSQGILQIQTPAGYASKADNVCIWRFIARGTGKAQLVFYSQALCRAGQVCPMYIIAMSFNFDVK